MTSARQARPRRASASRRWPVPAAAATTWTTKFRSDRPSRLSAEIGRHRAADLFCPCSARTGVGVLSFGAGDSRGETMIRIRSVLFALAVGLAPALAVRAAGRSDRREEDVRDAGLHDRRRRDDQERQDRLAGGRHAQCRQVERHPDHALLLRHQPRVRQIRRERQGRRLLGCDHRARQGDRHQQVLRAVVRHAGEPQRRARRTSSPPVRPASIPTPASLTA